MKWWYHLFLIIWTIPYFSGFVLLGFSFQDFFYTLFPNGPIDEVLYTLVLPWAILLSPILLYPAGKKRSRKNESLDDLKSRFN